MAQHHLDHRPGQWARHLFAILEDDVESRLSCRREGYVASSVEARRSQRDRSHAEAIDVVLADHIDLSSPVNDHVVASARGYHETAGGLVATEDNIEAHAVTEEAHGGPIR
jgi:hypothetical protein